MNELLKKIDEKQKLLMEHRPFEGYYLDLIKKYYKVGTTYSSNAIEGFSYTESETKILIEDGLTAGGKPLRDLYAVLGHAKAYDYMFSLMDKKSIREEDILIFHALLDGSLDTKAKSGHYRKTKIFVSGSEYKFMEAKEVPDAMNKVFQKYNKIKDTVHPVELSAFLHKEIVTVHPFTDGNGRISRLAMNTILIQNGYLPAVIPPILRSDYILAVDKTHYGKNNDFYKFIARCEYETLASMVRMLGEPELTASVDTKSEIIEGKIKKATASKRQKH